MSGRVEHEVIADLIAASVRGRLRRDDEFGLHRRGDVGLEEVPALEIQLGRDELVSGGADLQVQVRRTPCMPARGGDECTGRTIVRDLVGRRLNRVEPEPAVPVVGVEVPAGRGKPAMMITADEHPRPDTTIESPAALKTVRVGIDPASTVTAGNASGQNEGAAMCIVTTRGEAERRGLRAMMRLVSWAVAGVAPETMGIGPVPATAAALERSELTMADLDLIELNEAFASQVIACLREWKLADHDYARLNVNGSGISPGHPLGATGARILATPAHEMHRRNARYGLETMCIGGGQGLAAIFESVR